MRSPRLYVFAAGALALLATLILQGTYSSGRNQQSNLRKISVINRTRALQITKAEVVGRRIHLAVKNGYKKDINWFRVSFGHGLSIEADFAFTESGVLSPGENYADEYPIDSDLGALTVTVVAVVFEDKTQDGDERYAQFIRQKRAGQKMALRRLLPLLEKSITSSDDNLDSDLQSLEAETSTEEAIENTLPEAERIGLRNARERILNEVQRIRYERSKDKRRDVREDLRFVKNNYERIEAKLE